MSEQKSNVWLLCGGLAVVSFLLVFVGIRCGMAKETFAYLSALGSGFAGALWTMLRGAAPDKGDKG